VPWFGEGGKVKTKTLSVADTRKEHESYFLRKLALDVLKYFVIETKQVVICVFTDNAPNTISMIDKLKEKNEDCEKC